MQIHLLQRVVELLVVIRVDVKGMFRVNLAVLVVVLDTFIIHLVLSVVNLHKLEVG